MFKKAHTTLFTGFIAGAATLAACASGTKVSSAAGSIAPALPPNAYFIPSGTMMTGRFDQSVSTASRDGDQFTVTVTEPVQAHDGSIAIPVGTKLHGVVTGAHIAKVPGERNVIRLDIDQMHIHGRTFPFQGAISDVHVVNSNNASNRTVANTLLGGAAGTALGALITGGDAAGLIAGGVIGAGAGAVISMGSGTNEPATIPAGSSVTVQAAHDLSFK